MSVRTRHVEGGGGARIFLRDSGPQDAPPILLVHGWAQHHCAWAAQEPLAGAFRLVAIDLRGHGASDAPEGDAPYADGRMWADDLAAVIAALGLDRPVLVGWSYGSRAIACYLRHHGDAAIAGVVLAGGILALGRAREDWMVGRASPGLDRDLYTDDQDRRLAATARFVAACTAKPLDRLTYGMLVGANMLVPARVRRALFAADEDLRPDYARLARPGLAIHGEADAVVAPATGRAAAAAMAQGHYLGYPAIGHAPFIEAPARFNADLAEFVRAARETRPDEERHDRPA